MFLPTKVCNLKRVLCLQDNLQLKQGFSTEIVEIHAPVLA